MDDLARHNRARWEALARAGCRFTRPMFDLTPHTAHELVDPGNMMGQIAGRDVLCLAGGGGQQSAAFALLGAHVTVLDLSQTQLDRDRQAAEHYGLSVRTMQGDMRDLSAFGNGSFDVIYHAHSLNFIPDPMPVFEQAARVLRQGGLYRISYTNPFTHSLWNDAWNGSGYSLEDIYRDGEVLYEDAGWDFNNAAGDRQVVEGPREFRHTLSKVVNGLIGHGFSLLGLWEDGDGDASAEPGSVAHCEAVAPPWLVMWWRYDPAEADG